MILYLFYVLLEDSVHLLEHLTSFWRCCRETVKNWKLNFLLTVLWST